MIVDGQYVAKVCTFSVYLFQVGWSALIDFHLNRFVQGKKVLAGCHLLITHSITPADSEFYISQLQASVISLFKGQILLK